MAFDIQRARGSLPGRSRGVRFEADVRTGQSQVVAATGQLGGAVRDTAKTLFRLQAENQLSESRRQMQESLDQLSLDFEKDPDSTTYQKRFDDAMAQIQQFTPKNKLAARAFGNLLRNQRVAGKAMVQAIMLERERDTKRADIALMMTNGQFKLARKSIRKGVLDGTFSKVQAGQLIAESREDEIEFFHDKEKLAAEQIALTNPDAFLRLVRGNKIEGFALLTGGDVQDLQATAESKRNFNRRQENEALSAFFEDVSKRAEEGMAPSQMRDLLRNQPGLTIDEKETAMGVFMSSFNTWSEDGTKQNPWKTTQDYPALMRVQLAISSGQPITELDVWAAMTAGGKVNFSRSDALNLIGQLPDKREDVLKTPFADEWLAHVDELYLEDKIIPQEDIAEWSQARQGIEAIIKETHPDVGKAQKEIETFLKPIKEKKAKNLLSTIVGLHPAVLILRLHPAKLAFQAGRKISKSIFEKQTTEDVKNMSDEELRQIVHGK